MINNRGQHCVVTGRATTYGASIPYRIQLPANAPRMAQVCGPLHALKETQQKLLASDQTSSSHGSHLGSQLVDWRFLSVCPSLCE